MEGHPAPRRERGRHHRLPAVHSPLLWGLTPSLRLGHIRLTSDPPPSGHQPPSLKPDFWTVASPRAPQDVPSTLPTDVPLCMGVAGGSHPWVSVLLSFPGSPVGLWEKAGSSPHPVPQRFADFLSTEEICCSHHMFKVLEKLRPQHHSLGEVTSPCKPQLLHLNEGGNGHALISRDRNVVNEKTCLDHTR